MLKCWRKKRFCYRSVPLKGVYEFAWQYRIYTDGDGEGEEGEGGCGRKTLKQLFWY